MLPVIMTTDALTENEKIIYALIRDNGVMTRNELTEKTGMARGTKYEIL